MMLYGYARVSTTDQDLSLQEAALRQAGCQVIRSGKKTGTRREGRGLHREDKLSPSAIARRLGIARSSVNRLLPGAGAVPGVASASPEPAPSGAAP